jgi:hypothetical protein
MGVGLGTIAVGVAGWAVFAVAPAGAANSPTFRDCSFAGGLDPDFVQLSGATAGPNGTLMVSPSQSQVQIEASESSDPGDSNGADTLKVTVTAPNAAPRTLSGAGIGKVDLAVPLSGAAPGSSYSIDWAATFDNGNHMCPSGSTPQNTSPNPFVLTVSGGPAGGGPGTPGSPGSPPTFGGASFSAQRAKLGRKGRVGVKLACSASATGPCDGTLTLTARHGNRMLGHADVTLAAGTGGVVEVKLAAKELRKLRRQGRLKVKATVTVRDASGQSKTTSTTLTLLSG